MTETGRSLPKLMAVDDDVASAELIVRIAERCGYEAFATSDSRGVIALADTLKPDLLAIDICMPNIDANNLFLLLNEVKYSGIIILVSGQDHSILNSTAKYGRSLGLDVPFALQKPMPISDLRKILHECREARAVYAAGCLNSELRFAERKRPRHRVKQMFIHHTTRS